MTCARHAPSKDEFLTGHEVHGAEGRWHIARATNGQRHTARRKACDAQFAVGVRGRMPNTRLRKAIALKLRKRRHRAAGHPKVAQRHKRRPRNGTHFLARRRARRAQKFLSEIVPV